MMKFCKRKFLVRELTFKKHLSVASIFFLLDQKLKRFWKNFIFKVKYSENLLYMLLYYRINLFFKMQRLYCSLFELKVIFYFFYSVFRCNFDSYDFFLLLIWFFFLNIFRLGVPADGSGWPDDIPDQVHGAGLRRGHQGHYPSRSVRPVRWTDGKLPGRGGGGRATVWRSSKSKINKTAHIDPSAPCGSGRFPTRVSGDGQHSSNFQSFRIGDDNLIYFRALSFFVWIKSGFCLIKFVSKNCQ